MYWFDKLDIVLASGSPRRKALMEEAGFKISVINPDIDESYPFEMPVEDVAEFLANQKSLACAYKTTEKATILITADSVVIQNGKILGKPGSADEAVFMLRAISGKQHDVITGVCLQSAKKTLSFSCKTEVELSQLTEEEINYYVKYYQPFDKAGAYGIQEWIGLCKISSIQGSYSNVMGLPMERLYHELMKMI